MSDMANEGAKALAFFEWARSRFWDDECCEIDGGEFQDRAESLGLIVKVPFDPDQHSDNGYGLEPGDDWYVTHPAVAKAIRAATRQPTTQAKGGGETP